MNFVTGVCRRVYMNRKGKARLRPSLFLQFIVAQIERGDKRHLKNQKVR